MNLQRNGFRTITLAVALLMMVNNVATKEEESLPSNHKSIDEISLKPSLNDTLLKMEARINVDDGLDLLQFESKENLSKPVSLSLNASPQIISKNGVSYVTAISEPRITASSSSSSSSERKGEVFEGDKNVASVIPALAEDRGLRNTKIPGKDSYLDALAHSHTSKDEKEGIVHTDVKPKAPKIFRRDYQEGPVYRPDSERYGAPIKTQATNYGIPDYDNPSAPAPTQSAFYPTPSNSYSLPEHSFDSFGPSTSYGSPQSSYGSPQPSYGSPQPTPTNPQPTYGTPQPTYGAPQIPQSNYGPPSSAYGAPMIQNGYNPPSNNYLPPQSAQQGYGLPAPTYGAPYALPGIPSLPSLPMIDFTWPFALKLNAFTVAKILLKLVIFKMIVKFIAVICLLLFIPKLEIGKKDEDREDDEEGRRIRSSNGATDRLNFLTTMVMSAIENHDNKYRKNPRLLQDNCTSFGCRLMKTLTSGESWNDYIQLFKSYAVEEEERKIVKKELAEHKTKNT